MYELSFVLNNIWYTVIGDRATIFLIKDIVEERVESVHGKDSRELKLLNINKVGCR